MTLDQHEMLAYERDDLHREIVRHQGNQLMQTQRWTRPGACRSNGWAAMTASRCCSSGSTATTRPAS
jgi:hypothetical protein